jgi:high-affinity Fe2+/Pb2+ permease
VIKDIPIDEITRIISLSAAPAFLLGTIVGMLSLLVGRLSRLQDRSETTAGSHARKGEVRRLGYIRTALALCVFSGVATGLMVDLVFVDTLFGWQNSRTIVLMFIVAIVFFTLALIFFLVEILHSVHDGARGNAW